VVIAGQRLAASTGSAWPLWNNPDTKYSEPGHANCNLPFYVTPSPARELVTGRAEVDNLKLIPALQKAGEEKRQTRD
jgi:hypothetical protein